MAKRNFQKETTEPGPFCFVCGYDLRGLDLSRCPECGTPVGPDYEAHLHIHQVSSLLRALRFFYFIGCLGVYATLALAVVSAPLGGMWMRVMMFYWCLAALASIGVKARISRTPGHVAMLARTSEQTRDNYDCQCRRTVRMLYVSLTIVVLFLARVMPLARSFWVE